MVMKERDEELAMFLEVRRREKENEKNNLLLLENSEEIDLSNSESNRGSSPVSKIVSSVPPRKTGAEEFLNSENEKSNCDWLLTPPATPLFPTLEKQRQISVKSETEIPNARPTPTALKPKLANIQVGPASRCNVASKHPLVMPELGSSATGNRKPSSSGGQTSATSRSSTPSGRPTLPSTTKSSRPSTPTSRSTLTSAKPTAPPVRSSIPTRSTARASTPTARLSIATPKTTRRSATPTLRSSTPSTAPRASAPPTRSSSASKARPTLSQNQVQSRGSSPSVKSGPWEPSQMPGFSLDAPPNLKTSMPERPTSTTRNRHGATNSRSSSVEANSNGKSERQSCIPFRGRQASTGFAHSNQKSIQALSRSCFIEGDHESPVVIGTKMVERVVNMRKLAPPKHEDHHSAHNNSSRKSSLSDNSGFGRTLSKKSLDMAMRHMDIRRNIHGNLRPLVTSIPASSMCSVRSTGSSKSMRVGVSDSPLATSSNASSEPSVNNNFISHDGSEIGENDFGNEKGNSFTTQSSQ